MKTSSKKWQKIRKIKGLRQFVTWYPRHVSENPGFIATQYDIMWREDLFTGWDFYDVSQGEEFRRNGYKVVVPYMDKSWCIHDDGFLNLSRYDEFRDIFLKEYK